MMLLNFLSDDFWQTIFGLYQNIALFIVDHVWITIICAIVWYCFKNVDIKYYFSLRNIISVVLFFAVLLGILWSVMTYGYWIGGLTFLGILCIRYILVNIIYEKMYKMYKIIYKIIYKRKNRLEQVEDIYKKGLLACRKNDFDELEKKFEKFSILGIDGAWGTGKTYLVNRLLEKKKDQGWIVITIDALQINIDSLIHTIFTELSVVLRRHGIISGSLTTIVGKVNWSDKLAFLGNLLGVIKSPSDTLGALIQKLKYLNKNIVINYEDIDRIETGEQLRQILDINRKLEEGVEGIRIIYQYDYQKLKELGMDKRYVEKYIPQEMFLSTLTFDMIIQNIGSEWKKSHTNEEDPLEDVHWEAVFDKRVEWQHGISMAMVNTLEYIPKPLWVIPYDYRRIEEYYKLAQETLRDREDFTDKKNEVLKVLFIKIFYPDLYKELENYCLEENLAHYIEYDFNGKKMPWAAMIQIQKAEMESNDTENKGVKEKLETDLAYQRINQLMLFFGYGQQENLSNIGTIDIVVASLVNPSLKAFSDSEVLINKCIKIFDTYSSEEERVKAIHGVIKNKEYLNDYIRNQNRNDELFNNDFDYIFKAWSIVRFTTNVEDKYPDLWLKIFCLYTFWLHQNYSDNYVTLICRQAIKSAHTIKEIDAIVSLYSDFFDKMMQDIYWDDLVIYIHDFLYTFVVSSHMRYGPITKIENLKNIHLEYNENNRLLVIDCLEDSIQSIKSQHTNLSNKLQTKINKLKRIDQDNNIESKVINDTFKNIEGLIDKLKSHIKGNKNIKVRDRRFATSNTTYKELDRLRERIGQNISIEAIEREYEKDELSLNALEDLLDEKDNQK